MKRRLFVFAIGAAAYFALVLPSFAEATTTKLNIQVNFVSEQPVPCANDGAGEIVDVDGPVRLVIRSTTSDSGVVQMFLHGNPQGLTGVGQTTGDVYHGVGSSQDIITMTPSGSPQTFTSINNFMFVGPGTGNNFIVHTIIHLTVNANGEITADIEHDSFECK